MSSRRIGPRLRQLRTEAGLTQAELAERAGVADGTISRLERGRIAAPSAKLVEKLAEGLGTPVASLLKARVSRGRKPSPRPSEARLLALVRDLDDGQVDDITRAVKLLIGVGKRAADPGRRPSARGR